MIVIIVKPWNLPGYTMTLGITEDREVVRAFHDDGMICWHRRGPAIAPYFWEHVAYRAVYCPTLETFARVLGRVRWLVSAPAGKTRTV